MLFHSLTYAALLAFTLIACVLLRPSLRRIALLMASFLFYAAWRVEYFLLLLVTTLSCHYGALALERYPRHRRAILIGSIGLNLGILFVFKYYSFATDSLNTLLGLNLETDTGFLLPVGISFYTFQAIGYIVDVSRGVIPAERNPLRTTLFVSFFPQLVAGPIERAKRLLPALSVPTSFRWKNFRIGGWLILWGLFKKLVIADRLAILVDAAYATPDQSSSLALTIATYAFAFQIYCDFSGYSDIAIGSAKLFGIDLMQNFRQPYLASSLRDFWARWHISLSTWFRDYLYIPLGGSQCKTLRWSRNILIVFLVSGLWHGAAWTFVIWGFIHGLGILCEAVLSRLLPDHTSGNTSSHPVVRSIKIFVTFHIVLVSWVFFRAENLSDALFILQRITEIGAGPLALPDAFSNLERVIAVAGLAWMLAIEGYCSGNMRLLFGIRPRWLRQVLVLATLLLLLNFGLFSNPAQFVYFQF